MLLRYSSEALTAIFTAGTEGNQACDSCPRELKDEGACLPTARACCFAWVVPTVSEEEKTNRKTAGSLALCVAFVCFWMFP